VKLKWTAHALSSPKQGSQGVIGPIKPLRNQRLHNGTGYYLSKKLTLAPIHLD